MENIPLRLLLLNHVSGITLARLLATEEAEEIISSARVLKNGDLNQEGIEVHCQDIQESFSLIATQSTRRNVLQTGDVLTTLKFKTFWAAAVGHTNPAMPMYAYNNVLGLRLQQEHLHPHFLVLWFRSEPGQAAVHEISRVVETSQRKGLSRNMEWVTTKAFLDLEIPLPSMQHQLEIVNSYHALQNTLEAYKLCIERQQEALRSAFLHLR